MATTDDRAWDKRQPFTKEGIAHLRHDLDGLPDTVLMLTPQGKRIWRGLIDRLAIALYALGWRRE